MSMENHIDETKAMDVTFNPIASSNISIQHATAYTINIGQQQLTLQKPGPSYSLEFNLLIHGDPNLT
ncbi:hypothetical protein KIN20_026505 [Parelaphostrongylus tenuis]|uniref:Uncharacterized protein n=1 Tax=Parelaphostrongylus tenuis TaxID=148309 RepID=A0AAD5QN43_PARTN|nr:hypothetical protein KIN20_012915 [Parelaphostrongylus tenuis]KAJ1365996.1 hypothetical protein KIN20_026505 [Parelaphostrongylus tenuis]